MTINATFHKSDAALAAEQNALRDAIDAGAGPGKCRIYDGTRPANANTAITTQNLLATLVLPKPCAPDATDGVLTLDPIDPVVIAVSGTASWARISDADGNVIGDVDVADSGSPAILLDSASLVLGGGLTVGTFTVTEV